jgi:hypothetical protein
MRRERKLDMVLTNQEEILAKKQGAVGAEGDSELPAGD